jgi:hypothetical protein
MTKLNWWKWATMCVGIGLASLATLAAEPGALREAEPVATAQDPAKNYYKGSSSCVRCHNNGDQTLQPLPTQYFVKYDEFKTWKTQDKHSLAYSNLLGPRGRKMATLLNVADPTDLKAGCIGCHGAGQAEAGDLIQSKLFDPNDGVSCENCHGPSSKWGLTHAEPEFRQTSSQDREKMGLIDLRLPARQAEQCLSCHIGKSDEGKVVTHEMYAAGHPPLPSVEVATFSDYIPRHWWLVGEKPSIKVRQAVGFVEGTKEKTRLSLVSAAAALKTSMELLSTETKAAGTSTVPGLAWPDYARFDCWSCHHDLKRESWRQARGYEGAPGRPPISEWPLAVVKLGIARLVLDDPSAKTLQGELLAHQKAVLDEANARPYGRKAGLATAANLFAVWADALMQRLSTAPYDEAVSAKLLRILVESADETVVDYDAARQIAWTIKILVADSGSKLGDKKEAIEAIIKKLDTGLNLILPAGREYKIEDELGKALQIIGDYEPSMFQKDLKELLSLLPPA